MVRALAKHARRAREACPQGARSMPAFPHRLTGVLRQACPVFGRRSPFCQPQPDQVGGFFAWLQDTYLTEPDGAAPRGKQRLSPKSILNIHTNLSALSRWAVTEGYTSENLLHTIYFKHISLISRGNRNTT